MEIKDLIPVLEEQREEIAERGSQALIERPAMTQLSLTSKRAQVVIGVRRSGKSTLCEMFLRNSGVAFGYANFDEERLQRLQADDLNRLLEAMYYVYGNIDVLFFDEIQNVDGWPLFVNRLLRQGKHIVLTGSNSKLLSNELITHLTGRYHRVDLYPCSFREYAALMQADLRSATTKARALRLRLLHQYLNEGGFPELVFEADKREYVDGLLNAIIRNDIARRFKVRHVEVLRRMANYLADNFAQEFVAQEVGKMFGITNHTAENYYGYLKEAFLFVGINKFSYKARERVRNEKCYVIDTAFVSQRESTFSLENLGWRLENAVCIELLRRYRPLYADVFYYKERNFEVDFVIAKDGVVKELIQVSYDISSEKTRKRELRGLTCGARKLNCNQLTLITFDQQEDIEQEGCTIHVVTAAAWLAESKNSGHILQFA